MLVNILYDETGQDADIADLPERFADSLEKVQEEFFRWLFNKDNDHGYWVIEDGEKKYCSYDSEAFVSWLNDYQLAKGEPEASVVEKNVKQIDHDLPELFF